MIEEGIRIEALPELEKPLLIAGVRSPSLPNRVIYRVVPPGGTPFPNFRSTRRGEEPGKFSASKSEKSSGTWKNALVSNFISIHKHHFTSSEPGILRGEGNKRVGNAIFPI